MADADDGTFINQPKGKQELSLQSGGQAEGPYNLKGPYDQQKMKVTTTQNQLAEAAEIGCKLF